MLLTGVPYDEKAFVFLKTLIKVEIENNDVRPLGNSMKK